MKTGWRHAYRSFYYEDLPELPEIELPASATALLVIDLQRCYLPDQPPEDPAALRDYHRWAPFRKRLRETVLPATRRLLDRFRQLGRDVLFVRIACLTADGRDRSLSQARPGFNNLLLPKDAPSSQILDEVAPLPAEIVLTKTAVLKEALDHFDIGNHHFPAICRAALSKRLVETAPPNLRYAILSSGGGEAIDIALKCARYATKRKKIVSIAKAYHGHTGLALGTADGRYARQFLSEGTEPEFLKVPFNDLPAIEAALAGGDAACVIMETIPATYGFPLPDEGYLAGVKALCLRYGSLYVADEVQTGLLRCGGGHLWGITSYGVQPDILVTSKGLSGGLYPIGAVLVNEAAGGWLKEDGWGHISTFGGAELGCIAALKTLEITLRPETISNVDAVALRLREGLDRIRERHSSFFTGIRQRGVIFGLEFSTHPEGARFVMSELYKQGVWAIFSQLDPTVLQFKAGLLLTPQQCEDILQRTEAGIAAAAHART